MLGSLVEQLESARSESAKIDDYAVEMEKVHAALQMLQSSLRLEDGDTQTGAAVPTMATDASPVSRAAADAQWPAIAEALPEEALLLHNGEADTNVITSYDRTNGVNGEVGDVSDMESTAAVIEALTGLRSEISSLLPQHEDIDITPFF